MAIPVKLEQQVNEMISSIHQERDPLRRAQRASDLVAWLQSEVEQLSRIRRDAIAEAVQWPNESMATVAKRLGLSKSAVAKLATPDIRDVIASDLRARLARGFNPPPPAPQAQMRPRPPRPN